MVDNMDDTDMTGIMLLLDDENEKRKITWVEPILISRKNLVYFISYFKNCYIKFHNNSKILFAWINSRLTIL